MDVNFVIFYRSQNIIFPKGVVNGFFQGRIRFLDWAKAFSRFCRLPAVLTPGKVIKIYYGYWYWEHRCSSFLFNGPGYSGWSDLPDVMLLLKFVTTVNRIKLQRLYLPKEFNDYQEDNNDGQHIDKTAGVRNARND